MNYYASYYKCALQVNPYCYAQYRGEECLDEDIYNEQIVQKCIETGIQIVGLANHGNIDSSESLRNKLRENGIIVFPGFEIMSAEKIHMVCLFSEEKTASELNRILGALGLASAATGNETSSKTCIQIAEELQKFDGFWYAAHITSDNGVLKLGKMQNVWKHNLMIAAQIPDSKENIDPKYKNILNNTDPEYKRDKLPALINACDIDKADDLLKETATTLIKMTTPTFENFVMAFKDADSRIRLNSESTEGYQSCLKTIKVFGGYLDGVEIEFSDNLVAIIGGRGTGKSTIINLIRYALDLGPSEKQRGREFNELIEHNLGSSSRVELELTSNARYGQKFKIIRRFKADPVIEDENGKVSNLKIPDILPAIEIYGQNEIVDAVRDPALINGIVKRLFNIEKSLEGRLDNAYRLLHENSEALNLLEKEELEDEKEIADLPALKERLKYYQESGLEGKLGLIKKFTMQESLFDNFLKGIPKRQVVYSTISFSTSDEELRDLNSLTNTFNQKIATLNEQYDATLEWLEKEYNLLRSSWEEKKAGYDEEVKNSLKLIQDVQDKSSNEIVSDYTDVLKKVQSANPIQERREERMRRITQLKNDRIDLIEQCRKGLDEYTTEINKQLKKLNKKKLNNIVRLSVKFRQQKKDLLQKLKKIDGIGEKSIVGIDTYDEFDVFAFVEDIRQGADAIKSKYSLTPNTAEKIVVGLKEEDLRLIEEMRLPDLYVIELYVNGQYKQMENLSKGQQCTAILNILLLENKDPLIIDQPEDNLDNAFVAENLISCIRENKIKRQYIFATHNANIPVFGDAELIITMEEVDGQGKIAEGGIGSIDLSHVKEHVIKILEGGETAFKMREAKYRL